MTVERQEASWEETSGFVSSNVAAFRYDRNTDTLQVDFVSGDTYEYLNVPPSVHRMFQAAGSKGEYFARHIRGRYQYGPV